jgi:hypothetical protein
MSLTLGEVLFKHLDAAAWSQMVSSSTSSDLRASRSLQVRRYFRVGLTGLNLRPLDPQNIAVRRSRWLWALLGTARRS